jgi:hypothetical protein
MTTKNSAKCRACGADRFDDQCIIVATATVPACPCSDAHGDNLLSVHNVFHKAGFNTQYKRSPDSTALACHQLNVHMSNFIPDACCSSVVDALKYGLFRCCACNASVLFPGEQTWPETLVLNLKRDVSVDVYSCRPFTSDCDKFETASLTGLPGPSYTLVCATVMIPHSRLELRDTVGAYRTATVVDEFSWHLSRHLPVSMIFVQDKFLFKEQMQQLENDALLAIASPPILERRDFIIRQLCPQVTQICACDAEVAKIALLSNDGNVELAVDAVLQAAAHSIPWSIEAPFVLPFFPNFCNDKYILGTCIVLVLAFFFEHSYWSAKTGHANGEFYSTSPFNWIYVASFCLVAFLGYSLVRGIQARKTCRHVIVTRWLKRASVTFYALVILFVISLVVCADEIRDYDTSY